MNKVVVIGSLNIDLITKIGRLPLQGETMSVREQVTSFGGKGANQAVAAARQGSEVTFVGAVGNDENGDAFKKLLRQENINTDYIVSKQQSTGSAVILLEENGHNTILVNGGANARLDVADIQNAKQVIEKADIVVAQLEVPSETVIEAFKIAKNAGAMTVLNPAPVRKQLDQELINYTDLIVPNETEAAALAKENPTTEVAVIEKTIYHKLQGQGLENVIITLGDKGVYYKVLNKSQLLPIFKVQTLDTTAAGDTFIGTIAANLHADYANLEETLLRSSLASSIAVSRAGAIASIPNSKDIEEQFKKNNDNTRVL